MIMYVRCTKCVSFSTEFVPLVVQLVGISAVILANLCVSYIMTSHTEEVSHVNSIQCGIVDTLPLQANPRKHSYIVFHK
jgi:hypothetical protein